jgi:hypothetical protein
VVAAAALGFEQQAIGWVTHRPPGNIVTVLIVQRVGAELLSCSASVLPAHDLSV